MFRPDRRQILAGALGSAAFPVLDLSSVHAQGSGTLRIAMTASDIPLPNGQTDQGAEGMRFVGYNVFDSLILWDRPRPTLRGALSRALPPRGPSTPPTGRAGPSCCAAA
jgi:peptide/nickel transport system substrate-binding protein